MISNIEQTITAIRLAGNIKAKELCKDNNVNFVAYTDGSSDNAHNREGGAAYIIFDKNGAYVKHNSKGFRNTTNNRMELLAIMSAVCSVEDEESILIVTDSKYCIGALEVECENCNCNEDIIRKYFRLIGNRKVSFHWVKGHNGTLGNEIVDELSTQAMKKVRGK